MVLRKEPLGTRGLTPPVCQLLRRGGARTLLCRIVYPCADKQCSPYENITIKTGRGRENLPRFFSELNKKFLEDL